ncbi:MAG TPA: lipopolysaccharide kinase InaA family protein [Planctomycetota bacterium]|nr:lipopolysaccharide kinase InaA family protein [Planctomycetota bacterium]
MGVRLLLDRALAPALSAAGINSADAVARIGGDPDATSLVTVVDLPVEGTVGRFHLKRYRYPDWKKSRGLLGRGTLFGTAPEIREFRNLAFLREKGIPAVRPIAAAAATGGGRLLWHALLTEHVPDAIDLERRLAIPGDPVRDDRLVRRRVAELLGRNIHRMHSEAFVHRDLFTRNVLVRVDEDGPTVWFCDCRRGGPPSFRAKPLHDFATLDLGLVKPWPRTDRVRVLRAYAGPEGSLASWARDIAKRRDRLAR